jgi:hypothetical protein
MITLEVGRVYSGEEFNKLTLTLSKKFVRLTNESEYHNGFQYKTGLNVDTLPFNPVETCRPGGLYFCDIEKFPHYLMYPSGDEIKTCVNMRQVTIPNDAKVYVEPEKYKTDRIILDDPLKIYEDYELCLEAVRYNGTLLKYVKEQTCGQRYISICLAAFKQNRAAVNYIEKPDLKRLLNIAYDINNIS